MVEPQPLIELRKAEVVADGQALHESHSRLRWHPSQLSAFLSPSLPHYQVSQRRLGADQRVPRRCILGFVQRRPVGYVDVEQVDLTIRAVDGARVVDEDVSVEARVGGGAWRGEREREEQSRAEQSRAEQSRAEQSKHLLTDARTHTLTPP